MTTSTPPHKRRLVNFLINPRLQLMLFLPYFVTLLTFVLTMQVVFRRVLVVFSEINLNPMAAQSMSLTEVASGLFWISSAGFILAGVAGYALVVVVSHRLLGPLYNIQRHVRRLNAGELDHRITLRRGDRLHDLADELNTLTEKFVSLSRPKP